MSQKIKVPSEEKTHIVLLYLAGKYGCYKAAKTADVSGATF